MAGLYSTQLLRLATGTAQWPPLDPHSGAVSASMTAQPCGSSMTLDLDLDHAGAVRQVGLSVRACAVGQAAATLFARGARGTTGPQLEQAHAVLARWLATDGPQPDWPGIAALEPVRAYPARHNAALLPWRTALQALSQPAAIPHAAIPPAAIPDVPA